jgi:uncharacterized protein YbjQ (UPF0145 family)
MEFLIKLLIFVCLFGIGWYFGRRAENKHLKELLVAEATLSYIRLGSRRFETRQQPGQLVMASVVISHDYFKWVWSQIHNFFGGRLGTYESLLDRARREAIVRLKQQAQEIGAQEILALRLVTTSIGEQGGMVEVLAYGTAIIGSKPPLQPAQWPPQL